MIVSVSGNNALGALLSKFRVGLGKLCNRVATAKKGGRSCVVDFGSENATSLVSSVGISRGKRRACGCSASSGRLDIADNVADAAGDRPKGSWIHIEGFWQHVCCCCFNVPLECWTLMRCRVRCSRSEEKEQKTEITSVTLFSQAGSKGLVQGMRRCQTTRYK